MGVNIKTVLVSIWIHKRALYFQPEWHLVFYTDADGGRANVSGWRRFSCLFAPWRIAVVMEFPTLTQVYLVLKRSLVGQKPKVVSCVFPWGLSCVLSCVFLFLLSPFLLLSFSSFLFRFWLGLFHLLFFSLGMPTPELQLVLYHTYSVLVYDKLVFMYLVHI